MDYPCLYKSKQCSNTRSVKISGGLHRFCLFHRRRANAAQRRWMRRRRIRRQTISIAEADGTNPQYHEKVENSQLRLRDIEVEAAAGSVPRRRSTALALGVKLEPRQLQTTSRESSQEPVDPGMNNFNFEPILVHESPALSEEDLAILQILILDADDSNAVESPFLVTRHRTCWWGLDCLASLEVHTA